MRSTGAQVHPVLHFEASLQGREQKLPLASRMQRAGKALHKNPSLHGSPSA